MSNEKTHPTKVYRPRAKFRPWPPGSSALFARIHSWSTKSKIGFIDHKPKGKPHETIIVKHAALSTDKTGCLNDFWVEYYESGIEDDKGYVPKEGVKVMRTLRQGSHRLITASIAIARLDDDEASGRLAKKQT